MGNNDHVGYWGLPTSSIEWCEDNYVVSYYIAEFFNSFSSFAMIILGEAACYSIDALQASMNHNAQSTTSSSTSSSSSRALVTSSPSLFRFKLAFRTITVVGIGSFLFHATLLHQMQMLDELPMLYSVLALFFCLIESRFGPQPAWFPALLTAHGIIVTALVAFTEGNTQFYSFHGSFGSLEFATLYLVYRVYRARKQEYPDVKRTFETGIGLYALAIGVWMTDLNFCESPVFAWLPEYISSPLAGWKSSQWIVKDFYMHAWWHIFVSMGLYLLSTVIMLDGLIVQGWKPKIERRAGGWLPVVTVVGTIDGAASKKTS
ncbi:Alkaline ceramidase 3 [Dissophora globulifera]|uniref:Alkaline ceramidase 3 n=1 Tax=Dissophora globulifera TaxID=979702 RepID=A0A9P6R8Y3_9FUNG|nr:Alkaline ceramidase 3 [Dissophora globulifera]